MWKISVALDRREGTPEEVRLDGTNDAGAKKTASFENKKGPPSRLVALLLRACIAKKLSKPAYYMRGDDARKLSQVVVKLTSGLGQKVKPLTEWKMIRYSTGKSEEANGSAGDGRFWEKPSRSSWMYINAEVEVCFRSDERIYPIEAHELFAILKAVEKSGAVAPDHGFDTICKEYFDQRKVDIANHPVASPDPTRSGVGLPGNADTPTMSGVELASRDNVPNTLWPPSRGTVTTHGKLDSFFESLQRAVQAAQHSVFLTDFSLLPFNIAEGVKQAESYRTTMDQLITTRAKAVANPLTIRRIVSILTRQKFLSVQQSLIEHGTCTHFAVAHFDLSNHHKEQLKLLAEGEDNDIEKIEKDGPAIPYPYNFQIIDSRLVFLSRPSYGYHASTDPDGITFEIEDPNLAREFERVFEKRWNNCLILKNLSSTPEESVIQDLARLFKISS